jgi:hypothetical protein
MMPAMQDALVVVGVGQDAPQEIVTLLPALSVKVFCAFAAVTVAEVVILYPSKVKPT